MGLLQKFRGGIVMIFWPPYFQTNKSDTSHENETLAIKNSRLMPSKLANLLAMGAHTRVIFLGDE